MITIRDVMTYVGKNGYGEVPISEDLYLSTGVYYVLSQEWRVWEPYIEKALGRVIRSASDGASYNFMSPLDDDTLPLHSSDIVVSRIDGHFKVCLGFEQ